ncbi:MAG: Serine/threonine protein phosphatase catalytic subunit [Candidatus Ozemobacter sibiricus]|jgi:hypothetical protein|uniref:protein-serine/threonine phosphatase n=1 Tax=Candidatus Ozemobacter sibiricus TaxID=2268124 RepID=A0A367ZDE0_9BACT|nr:MAG: Serine/threonine protein phosphatase catalytic subunit [Candidatus Ozemobacter sibiricus]
MGKGQPLSRAFFEQLLDGAQGKADVATLPWEPLSQFLEQVLAIVAAEPALIEWAPRATVVVGDTHSDVQTSNAVLDAYPSTPLIFLGDYSGRCQTRFDDVRNCLLLFVAKFLNRQQLILLRGNHEDEHVCSDNGLRQSLREIYGSSLGESAWRQFVAIFHQLPLAVSMGDLIILHGALPQVASLDELRRLPKGGSFCDHPLITQILWNDVSTRDALVENERCPGSLVYGRTTLSELLAAVGKKVLIHGHNFSAKGVGADGADICLYTCTTYFYLPRGGPSDPTDVQMPVPGNLLAHYDGQETIEVRTMPAFHLGEIPLLQVTIPRDGPPHATYLHSWRSNLFHFFHERGKKQ